MIKRFLIYGLVGWLAEIIWTGLGALIRGDITMRGYTFIWMLPIYGLMVLLEPVHNSLRNSSVIVRGGVYTIIIFAIEYLTGYMLRLLIGRCPWNYGNGPYSIDGLITLLFVPVWFCGGLIFELLHNYLITNKIGVKKS